MKCINIGECTEIHELWLACCQSRILIKIILEALGYISLFIFYENIVFVNYILNIRLWFDLFSFNFYTKAMSFQVGIVGIFGELYKFNYLDRFWFPCIFFLFLGNNKSDLLNDKNKIQQQQKKPLKYETKNV